MLGEQVAVVVASGVIGFVDNDVAATASVVALLVLLNTRKDWWSRTALRIGQIKE